MKKFIYADVWKRDAAKHATDTGGSISVLEDGTVAIECDDDYYSGTLTREQALELAHKVLEVQKEPPKDTEPAPHPIPPPGGVLPEDC